MKSKTKQFVLTSGINSSLSIIWMLSRTYILKAPAMARRFHTMMTPKITNIFAVLVMYTVDNMDIKHHCIEKGKEGN